MRKQSVTIPDLHQMSDEEVRQWLTSLTPNVIFANYKPLHDAIMTRMGRTARIITFTHKPPTIIHVVDAS